MEAALANGPLDQSVTRQLNWTISFARAKITKDTLLAKHKFTSDHRVRPSQVNEARLKSKGSSIFKRARHSTTTLQLPPSRQR